MDKTTKIYSAPTLVAAGSVVSRTLGEPIGTDLETVPTAPNPFLKMGI
jgi:hypothetical protein